MLALRTAVSALLVLALAAIAVLAPAWTYAISLALFGLPHVAMELRYLDQRFGARIANGTWYWLVLALVGIAVLRAAAIGNVGTTDARAAAEWLLGAVLAAAIWPQLRARGKAFAVLGAAVVLLSVAAANTAPVVALVLFALLHNVTPVGLLAERLRGAERRRALLACGAVFGMLPLAIAMGYFGHAVGALGLVGTESGPLDSGDLATHMPSFVPMPLLATQFGLDLFRAAAFLQCMHYAVVIGVLPRLGAGSPVQATRLAWPSAASFRQAVLFLTALLLVGFVGEFGSARACYGVFASIHAWIEVPVLLLACAASPRGPISPLAAPA